MATKSTAKTETASTKTSGKKPASKAPAPAAAAAARTSHRCIVRWLDKTTGSRCQKRTGSEKEAKEMVTMLEKRREVNPRYQIEG